MDEFKILRSHKLITNHSSPGLYSAGLNSLLDKQRKQRMLMQDAQSQKALSIYVECMEEAKHRLAAAERYAAGATTQPRLDTESACLQLRKTLELVAYAAIAPHKSKYEQWRTAAPKKPGDFRKNFNGREILASLTAINPYSYPRPLAPRVKTTNGWHYPPFRGEYLSKKRYERVCDKCSVLLHADNPWGNKNSIRNSSAIFLDTLRLSALY